MGHLTEDQQRQVRIFGWLCLFVLAGLTFTGIWQFFSHEPDPGWFNHQYGSGIRQRGSNPEGVADLHGVFGDASGALAVFGSAWLAYKILYRIPLLGILATVLAVAGILTGSLIQFNAVKIEGKTYQEAGNGYLQLFTSDIEFVVTDSYDFGESAIRWWTVAHVAIVPLFVAVAWFAQRRSTGVRERRNRQRDALRAGRTS